MEQLVFELVSPEPPTFANFVAGPNAEVLTALQRLAVGDDGTEASPEGKVPGNGECGCVIWGPPGSGRSHLLRAAVTAASATREAVYLDATLLRSEVLPNAGALVAVDNAELADATAQARLFTLFNHLRAGGGNLVVALDRPPAQLVLRDDLRSRLGWGLVYELCPLGDAEKPEALMAYARQRGFRLTDDVVAYLLAHGRRDMGSLVMALGALDRHSLATKRPVTVPLVRAWLQRQLTLR